MAALRTLIVDDEPLARSVLRDELAEIDGVEVVGEAENGAAALASIEALSPDLLLLDVQMPVLGGFETVRRIAGPLPAIIFVTAYDQHALEAFEVGAVDYLLKPIRPERLKQAVERAKRAGGRVSGARGVARTLDAELQARSPDQAAPKREKIVARRAHDYFLLDVGEVYALQAERDIVWVFTRERKYMATQTLQSLEERLRRASFERVHRGVLVNTEKIEKMAALSSQRWLLTLRNGLEFAVSKRRAPLVREMLRSR